MNVDKTELNDPGAAAHLASSEVSPVLFHSPGACSLAPHIALEEAGIAFTPVETLLAKGQHKTPEYLAITPRGKVPALVVDGRVLTENTAILTYIAQSYPEAALLPADAFEQARCISQMAWFSNTPHISQRSRFRPYYFIEDEARHPDIVAKGKANFWENLQEIDQLIGANAWFMGDAYTVVDPYALVFYGWGRTGGHPMETLQNYTRLVQRILARPAVQTVLKREKNPHFKEVWA